jgi:hypothetical protein
MLTMVIDANHLLQYIAEERYWQAASIASVLRKQAYENNTHLLAEELDKFIDLVVSATGNPERFAAMRHEWNLAILLHRRPMDLLPKHSKVHVDPEEFEITF